MDESIRQLPSTTFSGRRLTRRQIVAIQAVVRNFPALSRHELARTRRRHRVLCNSRFLIFPWVRVNNLASKTLSVLMRRLPADWQQHHGYRPWLVETFVDASRFRGTCYRAANWQWLGRTRGQGRKAPPKEVFVWPLIPDCQARLRDGDEATRTQRTPGPRPALAAPGFLDLRGTLTDALATVCEDTDRHWQRRRVLDTRLIALFVFRLVLARGAGYGTVLEALWAHCRSRGIALPQPQPVSPAAISTARRKVPAELFRTLHAEVRQRLDRRLPDRHRWHGHRRLETQPAPRTDPRRLSAPVPQCTLPAGPAQLPVPTALEDPGRL